MAKKKSSAVASATTSRARASWRGMVRFGLVSFPCEAFNAHPTAADHVALHQLHAECHSRIQHQKVCPIHGPVKNDEIVSGFEVSKGRYVEIDPEELDALRTEAERSLTIDAFVGPGEIDPLYYDGRMYFLSPDGAPAREPYTVFLEALKRSNRYGVGQVVMSGKEQVVLLRPYQDALHMALLNYAAEMRDPSKTIEPLATVTGLDKKVKLAEQLVESWSDNKFDFGTYQDAYAGKLKDLIDAKAAGKDLVAPEVEEEPKILNLIDALRRSLDRTGTTPVREPAARRKKSAASAAPAVARKTKAAKRRRVS